MKSLVITYLLYMRPCALIPEVFLRFFADVAGCFCQQLRGLLVLLRNVLATKRPAPNRENCPPSRRFDFDLDDDDFETMSKPLQPEYAAVHFVGSKSLHCLGRGKEQAQASG